MGGADSDAEQPHTPALADASAALLAELCARQSDSAENAAPAEATWSMDFVLSGAGAPETGSSDDEEGKGKGGWRQRSESEPDAGCHAFPLGAALPPVRGSG